MYPSRCLLNVANVPASTTLSGSAFQAPTTLCEKPPPHISLKLSPSHLEPVPPCNWHFRPGKKPLGGILQPHSSQNRNIPPEVNGPSHCLPLDRSDSRGGRGGKIPASDYPPCLCLSYFCRPLSGLPSASVFPVKNNQSVLYTASDFATPPPGWDWNQTFCGENQVGIDVL